MADRTRLTNRWNFRGMNTRLLPDALPVGKSPAAINVRADGDSKVRTRPGYNLIFDDSGASAFNTGAVYLTDLKSYSTLGTDSTPRILFHDSGGGVWLDNNVFQARVGSGGTGASMIPFRPSQSPQSWMYVCNSTGYEKFSAPDFSNNITAYKVGIAEPQSPPDACPDGFQYNEFTALAANWTQGGTAGAPADLTRSTDTVIAIFQDPASILPPATKIRYSVQVGTPQYQIGETLAFTKSSGGTIAAEVEDVYPPINGGTALQVTAIYYFSGTTGRCVIVPSQFQVGSNNDQLDANGNPIPSLPFLPGQIAGVRRGSLIKIGTEVAFVLSATTGPQGQLAIEVSTSGSHGIGETIIGIAAICCSGLSALVVGQTVTSAAISSAVTTGIGTLTHTLATNPFNLALGTHGTPQEDDYIHLSAAVDTPANVIEIKILFDVGDGSFTQNVLYYAIRQSVLQAAFNNVQTQLSTVQNQAQQNLVDNLADNSTPPEQQAFDVVATDPSASFIAATGALQYTEAIFPITELSRIGNDQSKTLANCNAVQIQVNCSGNLTVRYGSIWVGGGGQPDVATTASPYFYRVRPRSTLTGARGNPSPGTRYGVIPTRQPIIVSLPSAAYDPQIDTWDVERYGGTVTAQTPGITSPWRLVGIATSTSATFVDNVFDDAALAGEALDFDNFEPWPSVDIPWKADSGSSGVTNIGVIGTAIVATGAAGAFPSTILRWLPGTLITLNGQLTYTLWDRPVAITNGYLFRTVENAGNPTVTEMVVNEPNVANQHLPYSWGPDANGIVFACGDTLRPGALYSSKANNPDASPNNIYDLTATSEPLMGGEVIDGLSLVSSSRRWWQLQAALNLPQRWVPVETPAGRGLAAPFGHCTDGKYVYFWAKDSICQMIPGLPAIPLTDNDLANLFPHDGVPGADVTYAGFTFYAPAYQFAANFRLSIINYILRAHYFDSNGFARRLVLDMSPDSAGTPRMAWSSDETADPIVNSYQPEQPPGSLITSGTLFSQGYFIDANGKAYIEKDLANDNGVPISGVCATPEWDAGDARGTKQWLDAMIDSIPASTTGLNVAPSFKGQAAGSASVISSSTARSLKITPLGNPISNFLGLVLNWIDDFAHQSTPTQLFEWSSEFVPQPILIRSWQSVPTSHGLQGYHHIYRIRFAYLTKGSNAVTLTITAYDGTSPQTIILPATNGVYQKVEFVPTFNKALMFTYLASSPDEWAPILPDCEVLVGQWDRTGPYSSFKDLGGIEAS